MDRGSWKDKVPLGAAWRPGSEEGRRWSTRLFHGALALMGLWMVLIPLVPGVTEMVMRRFHLTSGQYPGWLPQQVVPAMYSFANRYRLTTGDDPLEAEESMAGAYWVNHYPPRFFTFSRRTGLGADRYFLYCRSDYRGRRLSTKMRVDRDGDGGFRMRVEEERYSVATP